MSLPTTHPRNISHFSSTCKVFSVFKTHETSIYITFGFYANSALSQANRNFYADLISCI